MRKISILSTVLAVCALMAHNHSAAQKINQVFRYPVKSAVIEYTHSGNTTGTSQHYIDDYGRRFAQFSQLKTKSFGSVSETNQQVVYKDSIMYTIDLIKREGIKTRIANLDEKEIEDWARDIDSLWKSMGYKKTGEEEILGRKCDIWEGMSTKIWLWQNLTLKTETYIFGKNVMEATRLDVGASGGADKFRIPDDIKMTEQTIDMGDPTLDTLRNELKKGLEEFRSLFDTKKKK